MARHDASDQVRLCQIPRRRSRNPLTGVSRMLFSPRVALPSSQIWRLLLSDSPIPHYLSCFSLKPWQACRKIRLWSRREREKHDIHLTEIHGGFLLLLFFFLPPPSATAPASNGVFRSRCVSTEACGEVKAWGRADK